MFDNWSIYGTFSNKNDYMGHLVTKMIRWVACVDDFYSLVSETLSLTRFARSFVRDKLSQPRKYKSHARATHVSNAIHTFSKV